jgi:heme oxygenase
MAGHRRLHGQPHFAALMGGGLDRSGYRDLLVRLLGFYRPFETAVLRGGESVFGIEPARRRRAWLLEADLRWLGLSADAVARIGECNRMPPADTSAQRLGCIYVTEGSTLGATLLAERARLLLGTADGAPDGRRFFLAYGPENGRLWRECCAAVERCADAVPGHVAEMVAGATATFAILDEWLNR